MTSGNGPVSLPCGCRTPRPVVRTLRNQPAPPPPKSDLNGLILGCSAMQNTKRNETFQPSPVRPRNESWNVHSTRAVRPAKHAENAPPAAVSWRREGQNRRESARPTCCRVRRWQTGGWRLDRRRSSAHGPASWPKASGASPRTLPWDGRSWAALGIGSGEGRWGGRWTLTGSLLCGTGRPRSSCAASCGCATTTAASWTATPL